jgi:hypothetical protein
MRTVVSGRWSVAGGQWSVIGLFLLTAFCLLPAVHAQTGGPYDLTHNVIATGGGSNSTGGVFSISGTVGQPAAGVSSTNFPPQYDLHGGFWFQNLAPTSAGVSITGRVTTAAGNGIRGVRLVLMSPDGTRRLATTTTFGYYAFDGVPAGGTYVLEISARRYTFADPSRVISVQDHLTGVDFTALP